MSGRGSTESAELEQALTEVLQSMRLETAFVSRAMLRGPYSVHSGVVGRPIFHAVATGRCGIRRDQDTELQFLEAGDVAVLTRGDPHVIADAAGRVTVPLGSLPRAERQTHIDVVKTHGTGPETHLMCGSFAFRHPASDVMLGLLPPLVVVRGRTEQGASDGHLVSWLSSSLELLDSELDRDTPGSAVFVARLLDLLVVHVLRRCVLEARDGSGWVGALRDPKIGRALALIHRKPDADWTAASLAAKVGMSRSAFFARFTDLVGEPPAQYVTRWRMHVAADLMSDDGLSLGQLAERVGYGSEDAFSKVFKRTMGVSPGRYRRGLRGADA